MKVLRFGFSNELELVANPSYLKEETCKIVEEGFMGETVSHL